MPFPSLLSRARRRRGSESRALSGARRLLVAAAAGLPLLVLSVACERQPAEEPAAGYGHGSGKPGGRGYDNHPLDGSGKRFSDSQGTEIKAPEEGHAESTGGNQEHREAGPEEKAARGER